MKIKIMWIDYIFFVVLAIYTALLFTPLSNLRIMPISIVLITVGFLILKNYIKKKK